MIYEDEAGAFRRTVRRAAQYTDWFEEGWAREWAMRTAADVLAAAGEQDLADDVLAQLQAVRRRAAEQGRAAFHAAAQARAEAAPPAA